jgi:hypothetical protein
MAVLPSFGGRCETLFSTPAPSTRSGVGASITPVKDSASKTFFVTPVFSTEDLVELPSDVGLDYRIKKEDTEQSLSCFRGIALDPNFTRAQVFLIKDGPLCIGVATLFAVPYKNLNKEIYFKRTDHKLVAQSFLELFPIHPDSFVIETGKMKILPQYRHKKLGEAILSQVLVPMIEQLCSSSHYEIIVKCATEGYLEGTIRDKMYQITRGLFTKEAGEIQISPEMEPLLGRVHSAAMFTSNQARRMQLDSLPGVVSFSLGPVFAKVIRNFSS